MGALTRRFIWVLAAVPLQEYTMIQLTAALASDTLVTNPEPVINAVLAALEAQRSAFLTNWLLVALLIGAFIIVGGLFIMIQRLTIIREQTDGMHKALLLAERKLALIEGEVKGRANQKEEDEISGKGE